MAKFLCPYCYEMHTKEQCLVTCLYHNTHDAKKVCANDFKKDPSGFVEENLKQNALNVHIQLLDYIVLNLKMRFQRT